MPKPHRIIIYFPPNRGDNSIFYEKFVELLPEIAAQKGYGLEYIPTVSGMDGSPARVILTASSKPTTGLLIAFAAAAVRDTKNRPVSYTLEGVKRTEKDQVVTIEYDLSLEPQGPT